MLTSKFYHETIRKAVVGFGNLFNNIYVDRKDNSDNVVQTLKVPLSYAPRQKFIARIEQIQSGQTREKQIILPAMAFEMVSLFYDPNRRVSLVQKNRAASSGNSVLSQYAPSPYNIQMSLYIYAKNQEDGLMIVEQILPYFNPDFNLTVNAVPGLGIKNDMPIVLDNISYDDQYEGDFRDRRAVVWTLDFTLKLNFYGPVSKEGVIRNVNIDFFNDAALSQKIQNLTTTTDSPTANVDAVTGFIDTFTDF